VKTLYEKNGISIKRFDHLNYSVHGVGTTTYHATLDKAVLKVAKHVADAASEELWSWLAEYETITHRVWDDLSRLVVEATQCTDWENKCLVDPLTGLESYNTEEYPDDH
jgi:hypothetical protein